MNYQAFWVFNFREFDGVDARHEIGRQLGEFADRGMSRVVLHLRFGHTVPYLSEKWATLLGHVFDCARQRGLKIIVWEDDSWPPGFVGGRLTLERPDLRGHNLFLSRRGVSGGIPAAWELGRLPVLAIRAVSGDGREEDLLGHVGTHATRWSVFHARHLYVGADRDADQVVYSRANQGDVRYFLDWTPPDRGEWTIYWLDRLEPAFKYSGYLLDSLSLEATRARLAWNFQWYHDRFAGHFGKTIAGFYCAEPPQNNWTGGLFERFESRFGYSLRERFFQLGYGSDDAVARTRMDFKQLVADLFAEHYVAPVTDWCRDRGVEFWARLEGDESIEIQSDLRGGIYPAVRRFSVPVFDLVNGLQFGDPAHARLNAGINFCNSIARQQGAASLFEGVGPVGWGMRLSDPDAQFNWAVVMGCDSLQCENFFYSIDGYRKSDCPPSQSYQNPSWKVFGAWRDRYEQLSAAIGPASPEPVKVALVLPIHSMNACRTACLVADAPPKDERERRIEDSFQALHQRLLEAHVPTDIVDERALEEATVLPGGLAVGKQTYSVAILPFVTHLSAGARRALDAFGEAGGTVIENPAEEDWNGLEKFAPSGIPDGCYTRLYRDGSARLVLVFNHTRRPIKTGGLEGLYARVPLSPSLPESDILPPGSLSLWREGSARPATHSADGPFVELPASAWTVEMPLNAVVLDDWNIRVLGSGRMDLENPAPAAFGIATCRPEPIYRQVELRGHEHREYGPGYTMAPDGYKPIIGASPFPLRVAYRCHFVPEHDVVDSLRLVMETEGVQGAWRLFVNRQPVSADDFEPARIYDVGNRCLRLAGRLVPGVANWIEIHVQADRPDHGLLEPVRIVGHFVLDRHPNGPRLNAPDAPAGLGDWSGYGYPEASGWATYRTTFSVGDTACDLDLGMVHEIASVFVDDRLVAHLFGPPFRVRLPTLAPGPHSLRVEVANGLGNLLQRLRNPSGLYGPVRLIPTIPAPPVPA
jgi:hypothetical protein